MGPDLLESFKILTHFVVETVGEDLAKFAVFDVLLSVEEPVGDLVLSGVVHDRHDALHLNGKQKARKLGTRDGQVKGYRQLMVYQSGAITVSTVDMLRIKTIHHKPTAGDANDHNQQEESKYV